MKVLNLTLSLIACAALAPGLVRAEPTESVPTPEPPEAVVKHSLGHKLLLYIPNRVLDVFDCVRARLRVGPGWAMGMRATDRVSFFGGDYRSIYVGLPGPRAPKKFKSPVGYEGLKGIIFMGVDATDVTCHPPEYSVSELEGSIHVLIAGADVGFDFWELADFFTGLVLIDLRKDDL